jgi:hypothetical protein
MDVNMAFWCTVSAIPAVEALCCIQESMSSHQVRYYVVVSYYF